MSKVHDLITEQFVKALDEGVIPWRMPWDKVSLGHQNLSSKKEYHGINTLLLHVSKLKNKFTSHYWLTYKQATAMGGNVKKGEKSTMILFWTMWDANKKKKGGTEMKLTAKNKDGIPVMRYYRVFNANQVEGITVPVLEKPKRTKHAD